MKKFAVSVIIPNYNGAALLPKTLPAVCTTARDGDEVIVVDDASTDSSVSLLCEQHSLSKTERTVRQDLPSEYLPDPLAVSPAIFEGHWTRGAKRVSIVLIALPENQRFAGAVNTGAAFAQHEYLFLCNSDALPAADCLDQALTHFTQPDVFAVGCRELDTAAPELSSGKNILWFERGLFQHARASEFLAGETAWASGGSAVIAAEKWFALLGFDLRFYPAYWEDIDLSFRARTRGWKVLFAPEAVVEHTHESTNEPVFGTQTIQNMSWKNAYAFTWKHATVLQKLQFLVWLPYWTWKRYV